VDDWQPRTQGKTAIQLHLKHTYGKGYKFLKSLSGGSLDFKHLKSLPANFGLVKPDSYHPPLIIDVSLPYVNKYFNCEFSYQNFAAGNYSLLYSILLTYDWSRVHKASSVDAAVASMPLYEMPWTKQFLVAISASPDFLPGSPIR
jgi:hypothetical protein